LLLVVQVYNISNGFIISQLADVTLAFPPLDSLARQKEVSEIQWQLTTQDMMLNDPLALGAL